MLALALTLLAAAQAPPVAALPAELSPKLARHDFAALEARLEQVQRGYENGSVSEFEAWAVWNTLSRRTAEPVVTLLERDHQAWAKERPDSAWALAARGLLFEGIGWTRRGTAYVNQVPGAQLQVLASYHELAERDCEAALRKRPRIVACYVSLLNIARSGGDHARAKAVLQSARTHVPESLLVDLAYMETLTPRWGGSYEQMDAFLAEVLTRTGTGRAGRDALRGYADSDRGWFAATVKTPDRWQRALAHYDDVVRAGGDLPAFHAGRGVSLESLGREEEALKEYDRAIELGPWGWPYSQAKLPQILARRAMILSKRGRHAEATRDAVAASRLAEDDSWIAEVAAYVAGRAKSQRSSAKP